MNADCPVCGSQDIEATQPWFCYEDDPTLEPDEIGDFWTCYSCGANWTAWYDWPEREDAYDLLDIEDDDK